MNGSIVWRLSNLVADTHEADQTFQLVFYFPKWRRSSKSPLAHLVLFPDGQQRCDNLYLSFFFYLFYHYSFLRVYQERNDKDKKVCVLLFAECKHFDLIKKSTLLFFFFRNRGKVKN